MNDFAYKNINVDIDPCKTHHSILRYSSFCLCSGQMHLRWIALRVCKWFLKSDIFTRWLWQLDKRIGSFLSVTVLTWHIFYMLLEIHKVSFLNAIIDRNSVFLNVTVVSHCVLLHGVKSINAMHWDIETFWFDHLFWWNMYSVKRNLGWPELMQIDTNGRKNQGTIVPHVFLKWDLLVDLWEFTSIMLNALL